MKRRSKGEGTVFFSEKEHIWVGEITLLDGSKKRKRSKNQKVVREWLLKQREAVRDHLIVMDERLTMGEFLDRYFSDVATPTLRPKTLQAYSYLIRLHIKPELGAYRLVSLSPAHLQKFYADQLNSGLSRRTVQFMHSILHKALSHALKWGLVVRNVADLVEAPTVKRKAPVTWSLQEVQEFLQAVKGHRFYPIYLLGIATGMREGELLGLQLSDIHWDTGTIHVQHALQYIIGQGLILAEPKTEKARRTIKVPEYALLVLKEYVDAQNRNQRFVFATKNNTPFSPRNIVRHFKQVLAKTGLPEIRFHDLRHTCATLHLMAGTHPKTVQDLLGHSQINLTLDTYSHVLPSVQDEAAERMNTLLKG